MYVRRDSSPEETNGSPIQLALLAAAAAAAFAREGRRRAPCTLLCKATKKKSKRKTNTMIANKIESRNTCIKVVR